MARVRPTANGRIAVAYTHSGTVSESTSAPKRRRTASRRKARLAMVASATGIRAARAFSPKAAKLAATVQYANGGLW